jgi:hypothetical protein
LYWKKVLLEEGNVMSSFVTWIKRMPGSSILSWKSHVEELLGPNLKGDWFQPSWCILEAMYNAHQEGLMYFPEVVRLAPGQDYTCIKLSTNWSKLVFGILEQVQKPLNEEARKHHVIIASNLLATG